MTNNTKDPAVCKLHVDLWIHQNVLLWSRIQTLYFVQVTFLSAAFYLTHNGFQLYGQMCVLLGAITTATLMFIMLNDRYWRDVHRDNAIACGLGVVPLPVYIKVKMLRVPVAVVENGLYAVIFLVFISLDIFAAFVVFRPS